MLPSMHFPDQEISRINKRVSIVLIHTVKHCANKSHVWKVGASLEFVIFASHQSHFKSNNFCNLQNSSVVQHYFAHIEKKENAIPDLCVRIGSSVRLRLRGGPGSGIRVCGCCTHKMSLSQ